MARSLWTLASIALVFCLVLLGGCRAQDIPAGPPDEGSGTSDAPATTLPPTPIMTVETTADPATTDPATITAAVTDQTTTDVAPDQTTTDAAVVTTSDSDSVDDDDSDSGISTTIIVVIVVCVLASIIVGVLIAVVGVSLSRRTQGIYETCEADDEQIGKAGKKPEVYL